jgi:hypothetical protein
VGDQVGGAFVREEQPGAFAIAAIAADGRVKPELVDVTAHMVLTASLEVALLVARADEGRLAIRRGQEAVDELLMALFAS